MDDVRIEAAAKALARIFDCDFDNASRGERRGFKGDAKAALKAADAVDPLRNQQRIETINEAEGVRVGTIVLGDDGDVSRLAAFEPVRRIGAEQVAHWETMGAGMRHASDMVIPATVLHEPRP